MLLFTIVGLFLSSLTVSFNSLLSSFSSLSSFTIFSRLLDIISVLLHLHFKCLFKLSLRVNTV